MERLTARGCAAFFGTQVPLSLMNAFALETPFEGMSGSVSCYPLATFSSVTEQRQ